ncbi:hypothetical protein [Streptomyces echinatus]|uniref:hypothetical protein n=1 Tax=Streptomyces echinatus TaxID=67293 RepID=UPI003787E4D0
MDDLTDPPLRPLPARAVRLLERVAAPPRPVAHLRAVHDVAAQFVDWVHGTARGWSSTPRPCCSAPPRTVRG